MRPNQIKKKKKISIQMHLREISTDLVHVVFCSLCVHRINTVYPPKHKLHLKSPNILFS